MPAEYPEYPSHVQFLQYLRSAAKAFELYDHTTFGVLVTKLEPDGDGWSAELSNGEQRWYADVVVANGVLRKPYIPEIPGEFSGEIIHSSDYSEPEVFNGKTVLIVGAGNSGCDIAVDGAHHAKRTFHSTRRGYHYMPKFISGKPTQEWLMEIVSDFDSPEAYWKHVKSTFKMAGHDGEDFGLPTPDHEMHQAHPIMNSNVLYHIGHGDILPKPDVVRFDGNEVVFKDDSRAQIDLVVLATGYQPSLLFLVRRLADWDGLHRFLSQRVPLKYDNIMFVGYFNIPSGFGNIANTCSRLVANYFLGKRKQSTAWKTINRLKRKRDQIDIGQSQFVSTRRHAYELDLWKYVKTVNFMNERLEAENQD